MTKLIRRFIYGKEYKKAEDKFEQLVAREDYLAEARAALGENIINQEELEEHTKDINAAYEKYEELRKKMRL